MGPPTVPQCGERAHPPQQHLCALRCLSVLLLVKAGNEGLAEARPDEADLALERPSRLLLLGTATAAIALIAISAFTFLTNADDEDETLPPAVEPAPSPRSAVTLAP